MGIDLRRNLKAVELLVKKFSPEILTAVGIVAGTAGAVIACKKSMTIKEKLEPIATEIDDLKDEAEDKCLIVDKKELTKKYGKAAVVIAKEYAPAIILGGVAVTSVLAANGIMRKRNAGLAAGYAALDKIFKDYRSRVIEDYGTEKDNDYYYGLKTEKVKEKVIDPETGKEKTVTKEVKKCYKTTDDTFTFIFGQGNPNYKGDPLLDRAFLAGIENWACDQVFRDGVIFNSDILRALGFEERNIPDACRVFGTLERNHKDEVHPVSLNIHQDANKLANNEADCNSVENNIEWIITISNDGYILGDESFMPRAE